ATKVPSDKITLLPYGTRRGSTAHWPARKRAPVEQTCRRVQGSDPLPPLAQYTVTRARIDCSRAKTGGAKNRMAVSEMKSLFIVRSPGFQEWNGRSERREPADIS